MSCINKFKSSCFSNGLEKVSFTLRNLRKATIRTSNIKFVPELSRTSVAKSYSMKSNPGQALTAQNFQTDTKHSILS